MASTHPPLPPNFWNDPTRDNSTFDWDSYLAGRPIYTASFYSHILTYHASKPTAQHLLLHDVATGPGTVAAALSPHFAHVVASDASPAFTAEAHRRLRARPDAAKFSTRHSPAEHLARWVPPATVDLLTVAEAIPMIDHAAFVAAAALVLRPAASLAIWFYGRPFFVDDLVRARCQPLLNALIERGFDRARPLRGSSYERPARTYRSYLDGVAFPRAQWTGVRRLKWNCDQRLEFLDHEGLDFEVPVESAIEEGEEVVECRDREIFALEGGVEWVRAFVGSVLPGRETDAGRVEGMERLYEELEEGMGGKGARQRIGWSVVLLLATRR